MEAILTTAHNRQPQISAGKWLRETWRLARAAWRVAGDALVNYSRAGLMVKNGSRPRRRF